MKLIFVGFWLFNSLPPGSALSPLPVFCVSPRPGDVSARPSTAPQPPHIPVEEFGCVIFPDIRV